jgi:hypothetical protein
MALEGKQKSIFNIGVYVEILQIVNVIREMIPMW